MKDLSDCRDDEIVSSYPFGLLTLKTTVAKIMAVPRDRRSPIAIFRESKIEPILDYQDVERLAGIL